MPVAVFVSPEGARAASAGTYILYAGACRGDGAGHRPWARRPRSRSGCRRQRPQAAAKDEEAPRPRQAGQSRSSPAEPPSDAMTAKQVHDAAAFIRGLAQLRGRNAEWAERAVREAVSLTAERGPEATR